MKIRNYKCKVCGEAFYQKHVLDDHMKHKHSEERNHICSVKGCGKAFKSEQSLRLHMKSYSDEKPHQCRYCEKAYKHFGALQSHVLKKHQNTKMEMIQKLKNDFHI